jgi:hypothetical protein
MLCSSNFSVARPVVGGEGFDDLLLLLVLGHSGRLLEPADDLGDGRPVEAVDPGDLLDDPAVRLDDARVEAVGDRRLIFRVDDAFIIGLDLGLGDALVELTRSVTRSGSSPGRILAPRRDRRDGFGKRRGRRGLASQRNAPSEPLTRAAK